MDNGQWTMRAVISGIVLISLFLIVPHAHAVGKCYETNGEDCDKVNR